MGPIERGAEGESREGRERINEADPVRPVDHWRDLAGPARFGAAPSAEESSRKAPAVALETWRDIVDVARHCPSPHNCQPWIVEPLEGNSANLYINGKRTFPWTDSTGSFIVSAMKMFTIYLESAAQNRGFAMHRELAEIASLDLRDPRSLFATVTLTPSDGAPGRYSDAALVRRKTSRKENLPIPMPESALREIEAIARKHGHSLVTTSDQKVIDTVLRRDIRALFHDVNFAPYFEELKPYLKLGKKENELDGLHYEAMNLPWMQLAALKYCPWAVKLPIVSGLVEGSYRSKLGHTERMGFVSGDFWDRKDALKAGDMLIEMWLALSKHDIHIHPFGNLVTNTEARRDIETLMGIQKMWFVFRVGYTDSPVKSERRSVDDILVR